MERDTPFGVNNTELSTLSINHIAGSDTPQDSVSVCSILDAMLALIRSEFTLHHTISIVSENVSCFQNSSIIAIVSFI